MTEFGAQDACAIVNSIKSLFLKEIKTFVYGGSYSGTKLQPVILKGKKMQLSALKPA